MRQLMVLLIVALAVLLPPEGRCQETEVRVDESGVMRWTDSGEEVSLFGANYTLPFAFAYRAHGYEGAVADGLSRKEAIERDVDHMARLGLEAFRIHVWDREVSDREGNLVENEHLDLLDYLLAEVQKHGIKTILTPIAWWGTGYPEPDPATKGFSEGRSKGDMTTEAAALRAQQTYLRQFMQHENPYTGRTYGGDPEIIAVELFNEPVHPAGPEATTRFINALVEAVRETGFEKPLFYNISQGYTDAHGRAVCEARVQGVAAQWYPAGLVRGDAIEANMLPNVDRYPTPFDDIAACRDKARMVYEFDPADVAGSYMYPAMARSFREAGFQWATQFAYDPLSTAHSNAEYPTHFVNLVYAPSRALSLMIGGEAFRRVPRGEDFGRYPETVTFGAFRVSYEEDLSELASAEAFYYSGDTGTQPPDAAALEHVAGVGRSPVVSYEGTGAYFLDRLAEGAWRLEVYPDAVRMEDPFAKPGLDRYVARLRYRAWPMKIALPDLGSSFSVTPVNAGNAYQPTVEDGKFAVRPGIYRVARADAHEAAVEDDFFYAPPATGGPPQVAHTPPSELEAGAAQTVRAQVVAGAPVDSVSLYVRRAGWSGFARVRMTRQRGYTYAAEVGEDLLAPGLIEYAVTVHTAGGASRTFPGGVAGAPEDWDYTGDQFWQADVVRPSSPVLLFGARRDRGRLLYPRSQVEDHFDAGLVPGSQPGALALRLAANTLAPEPQYLALRSFVAEDQKGRLENAGAYDIVRIRARAAGDAPSRMRVALVDEAGAAWGTVLALTPAWQTFTVPLAELRRTPLALLPRPYPTFLPYFFRSSSPAKRLDPRAIDGTQMALGAGLFEDDRSEGDLERRCGFEVERIVLGRR